jgi:hypothetical protein
MNEGNRYLGLGIWWPVLTAVVTALAVMAGAWMGNALARGSSPFDAAGFGAWFCDGWPYNVILLPIAAVPVTILAWRRRRPSSRPRHLP